MRALACARVCARARVRELHCHAVVLPAGHRRACSASRRPWLLHAFAHNERHLICCAVVEVKGVDPATWCRWGLKKGGALRTGRGRPGERCEKRDCEGSPRHTEPRHAAVGDSTARSLPTINNPCTHDQRRVARDAPSRETGGRAAELRGRELTRAPGRRARPRKSYTRLMKSSARRRSPSWKAPGPMCAEGPCACWIWRA